jgi:hypothetical protein
MNGRILVVGLVVASRVDSFDQSTVGEVVRFEADLLHLTEK